jgi:hypothetical protein
MSYFDVPAGSARYSFGQHALAPYFPSPTTKQPMEKREQVRRSNFDVMMFLFEKKSEMTETNKNTQ